jgi:hypothetical protein
LAEDIIWPDDMCPDIMLDDEGLGEGDGVPMEPAKAGAAVRAARMRVSAYVFKGASKQMIAVFPVVRRSARPG